MEVVNFIHQKNTLPPIYFKMVEDNIKKDTIITLENGIKMGFSNFETFSDKQYNIDNITDFSNFFYGCKNLKNVELTKTIYPTNAHQMFRTGGNSVSKLESIDFKYFNFKNIPNYDTLYSSNDNVSSQMFYYYEGTIINIDDLPQRTNNLAYIFYGCSKPQLFAKEIEKWGDLTHIYSFRNMFYVVSSNGQNVNIDELDLSNWNLGETQEVNNPFGDYITINKITLPEKGVFNWQFIQRQCYIIVNFNVKHLPSHTVIYNSAPYYSYYCVFKNIGFNPEQTVLNFSKMTSWGKAYILYNITADEAKQSVIDSLLTYSFDRAKAGYPTCTITLSANAKALLTTEQIAQITAKGYTIA